MNKAYGTWDSPISGKTAASGVGLRDVQWDSAGDTLVWQESRGGVGVLVAKRGADAARDLTDLSAHVAGKVGYGGGAFAVGSGHVYFVAGGRLRKQSLAGGDSVAISPEYGGHAGPAVSPDGRWVVYVHSYEGEDCLLIVDADGDDLPRKLASGTDFVMQPSWHPGGGHVAFVAWNHPQMPWNGSELRLIQLADEGIGPYAEDIVTVAGDSDTAIFQPSFSPDGRYLSYVSDSSGWGQIYLYDLETRGHVQVTDGEAEHGMPAWAQGMRSYGWSEGGRSLLYLENARGFFTMKRYCAESGESMTVAGLEEYSHMEQIATAVDGDAVAVIASSAVIPPRVVTVGGRSGGRIARRSQTENLQGGQLSRAEAITWRGEDGGTVHGLYYGPAPRDERPSGRPPLIVNVHGGPTSQRTAGYASEVQFFTTRGYAVLQVNHRGSTGYGKAYMDMHRGNWGVYDVLDSIAGVEHLAREGEIDRERVVIMGGSAGGFTVLQSMVDYPGFYKAGVCSYGVSNQFGLLMDTHKFEERYTYWLLGELPEASALYRERSPVFHADKIVDPLIVFQGTDDVVVPQDQSDSIVASLKRRGVAHAYHLFEGEGHGWRRPETIEVYYSEIERFLLQHVIYA